MKCGNITSSKADITEITYPKHPISQISKWAYDVHVESDLFLTHVCRRRPTVNYLMLGSILTGNNEFSRLSLLAEMRSRNSSPQLPYADETILSTKNRYLCSHSKDNLGRIFHRSCQCIKPRLNCLRVVGATTCLAILNL